MKQKNRTRISDELRLFGIEDLINSVKLCSKIPDFSDKLYIFGRNPMLSFAELHSVFRCHNIEEEIIDLSEAGIILSSAKTEYPKIKNFGSLLKKCRPVDIVRKNTNESEIYKIADEFVSKLLIDDKCHWCITAYNEKREDVDFYDLFQAAFRDALKKQKIKKHTYVPPDEGLDKVRTYKTPDILNQHIVMPKKIISKHVMENGFECVLWHRENDILVCLTEEVIDIKEFEARDVKRPYYRPKLGLGAALGRTMVNIAVSSEKQKLYDPFCGTGVILQEAYLGGFSPFGSDIDEDCIKGAKENLKWISKKYKKEKFPEENIFLLDFTRATSKIEPKSVPALATEPYLGPALKDYPSPYDAGKIIRDLSRRYDYFFRSLADILKPDGKAVMIVPRIRSDSGQYFSINTDELLKKHGLTVHREKINQTEVPYLFLHAPKDQKVERLIYVLKTSCR